MRKVNVLFRELDEGKRRGRREAEKEDKMGRLRFFKK